MDIFIETDTVLVYSNQINNHYFLHTWGHYLTKTVIGQILETLYSKDYVLGGKVAL